MGTATTKDFFISYTHADKNWAEWIAWHLEEASYTTILQAWDFHAGGNFVLAMDSATKQAGRTIAVLSPDYFASKYTPSEWAAAFRHDPKGELGLLVPVRVRPCDVEGLLGQVVYIDLVNQDEQTARSTLLASLQSGRQKPASAPPFPSVAHTLLERPSFPGALPRIWNIPYPRNAYFTGREELLTRLAAALQAGQTTALSQPQAISGLGGIGKTQTALEYAYRYHQNYQAVLWARADTYDALISGFVAFAELLQLPQKEEKDQLKVVQAVKDWLKMHDRWLLILDNADDLALVKDFLPSAGGGHTLLTTRAQSMGRLAGRIEVDTLAQAVGALFLLRRAGLLAPDAELQQAGVGDRATALAITQELGGLPLALDQAGAYIEKMQCSLPDYLQLYREHRAACSRNVEDSSPIILNLLPRRGPSPSARSSRPILLLLICCGCVPFCIPMLSRKRSSPREQNILALNCKRRRPIRWHGTLPSTRRCPIPCSGAALRIICSPSIG